MTFSDIAHNFRVHGAGPALLDLSVRALNRFFFLRIFVGLELSPSSLRAPAATLAPGWRCLVADRPLLDAASGDPELDLAPGFVDAAWRKSDECVVVLDDGEVASYCWLSNRPTVLEPGLSLSFASAWSYAYKAFTRPRHRGRRLLAVSLSEGLRRSIAAGGAGLLTVIEDINFSSLKAFQRVGFREIGRAYILGWREPAWVKHTGRCRDFGFVVQVDALSAGGGRSA